jgi:hypothetical protein
MEAQACLVDGHLVAALGDRAAATELFTRAADLGAAHGMPAIERNARTARDAL